MYDIFEVYNEQLKDRSIPKCKLSNGLIGFIDTTGIISKLDKQHNFNIIETKLIDEQNVCYEIIFTLKRKLKNNPKFSVTVEMGLKDWLGSKISEVH